jgi:WS/DGAT/MGAT family acyltransferase
MDQLSSLDAGFLHFESPETPMHVGSVITVKLPDGYAGDFYEDVKARLAARLHLIPVFERRLASMPLDIAEPVWIDDEEIDLDYHVRRVMLPKPGTHEQLERYVGRLHSNLLDRSRPLWETYVIEGLASGLVSIYTKVHHAGLDGVAGVALAAAILDATAEPAEVEPPPEPRERRGPPGVVELAGAAVSNMASQYVRLVKLLPDAAKAVVKIALPGPRTESAPRAASRLPLGFDFAPRTPLSVAITGQRSFAARSLALADAKAISKGFGVTINDVVMWLCGTALRNYLAEHDFVPDKSLVAAVPVSLRSAGDSQSNNQVTLTLANLATDVDDPVERLRAVHRSCRLVKHYTGSLKAALPLDLPFFGAPWLMGALASIYGQTWHADMVPPFANAVVSNVPGPQFPLYFAGARVVSYHPVSIPYHGVAINITVQSYNGSLDFGITACRRAVPDVVRVADLLVEALAELKSLIPIPEVAPDAPPKAKPRQRRVRAATASAPTAPSRPKRKVKRSEPKA